MYSIDRIMKMIHTCSFYINLTPLDAEKNFLVYTPVRMYSVMEIFTVLSLLMKNQREYSIWIIGLIALVNT